MSPHWSLGRIYKFKNTLFLKYRFAINLELRKKLNDVVKKYILLAGEPNFT